MLPCVCVRVGGCVVGCVAQEFVRLSLCVLYGSVWRIRVWCGMSVCELVYCIFIMYESVLQECVSV